jgi:altronate dehydratase large subunit
MKDSFFSTLTGYRRASGEVGVRNIVAVMAAADNVNPFVRRLAHGVPGVCCIPASYGRGQLGRDFDITLTAMAGLAGHPNVAECLIISFEPESAERIADRVRARGRDTETLSLLAAGGQTRAVEAGVAMLNAMVQRAKRATRAPMAAADLIIGLECGGSDTTSGLVGNPSLGAFCDRVIDAGGTAIFSEPVECLGGEQLLASRAVSPEAASAILAVVARYRDIALEQGIDLTGVNPTPDNIAGGLTTIEEKSLGAIAKTGARRIEGVIGYGERPSRTGLWLMEGPAGAVENITGLSAAGAHIVLFVTGSCNPVGHPVSPTIKICANPATVARMAEHIDVDLSHGLSGAFTVDQGGDEIAAVAADVAAGRETAAERLGFLETNISRFGLSV